MKKYFILITVFICESIYCQVNLNYYLDENHPYNSEIPKPEELLGYEVGTWHVSHDQLISYMYDLAESSDRISIENRGSTYEDRPLLLLTITSPESHKNIKSIRKAHIQLSEVKGENENTQKQPLVVYQGFSIHGNEPSGANAGLLAAYHLAASQASETLEMLENLIILFDPSLNPDGLQRFSYWANMNKNQVLTSDSNGREYNEIWPGGRTNHYWFDLNRDWLPVQLPESRARIKTFTNWLPNILTDHHEMGTNSTFFFQPGVSSRVNPLIPLMNQKLTKEISKYHIEAFDKLGSLYYSEEDYDDFYLGKGSAYPDVNGGIGILFFFFFSRGHMQESEYGLITFPFTLRNQLTAALSTLKAASSMRIELLDYFTTFYADMRKNAANEKQKLIIIGSPKDPATLYHFAEILDKHKIKFYELKNQVIKGRKKYLPKSSFVIPLEQTKNKLIQAMFTKQISFQDSLFYDVSAWTFPYAFNLNYHFENNISLKGERIEKISPPMGSVSKKGDYAYLFEAHHYYTPKLLNELHKKNIRVKVGLTPFTIEGKPYDYGTYMIPSKNQEVDESELYEILKNVAIKTHININGVSTGNTQGIDLGSRDFHPVKKAKIALLVGSGVRSYDAGEIWHLLDTRHEISISKIDTKDLNGIDLSTYSHLIIPSFSGSNLNNHIDKIKRFVKEGGVLIGYRETLKWLDENDFIKLDFLNQTPIAENISFEDKDNFEGAQETGGSIFSVKIDRSHPINFGYLNSTIPIFRNTNLYLKADKQSYNNPIQYTSKPLLSGYISEENLQLVKRSVPFKISRMGYGKVIVLTDNTNFRAFWYGTNKILTNAIYLSFIM